jgi:glycosyltransferase involved in cell wall biosynthesis
MKKILFLANHRKDRSPGQRFRFEQYLNYLNQNGFQCELSSLLSEEDDKIFYSKGNWISKLFIFFKCFNKRLKDVRRAQQFDIVFVFREAFFTGTTYFEKRLNKLSTKVVFDFDDSIWIPNVSTANKRLEWLKNYEKTSELIQLSDLVFAGNQYLANYALMNNNNVVIIPTTIDTKEYQKIETVNDKICIGWSGSITTIQHFEYAIPFLKKIKQKYGDNIEIKVIGDENYVNQGLDIKGIAWNKKDEIKELSSFDIGIMPLPNDEWSNGKCGLKGLQYMALEIPTIMSPVGVNTEIIQDGINGFIADEENEWIAKIVQLIESKELRTKMGKAGRRTVVENYSVDSTKEKYLDQLRRLLEL